MSVNSAAGVDAGKSYFDVAFAPEPVSFRVENSKAGVRTILARLKKAGITRVVLEAIGFYATPLVDALTAAGITVGIVNPRRIKAFRDAEGKRAKNDRLDAALIARFAIAMTDAIRPLPSAEQRAIKALATRRRQLVEMVAIEKTRLKQAPSTRIAESHRKAILALSEMRSAIECELDALVAESADMARRREIFTSIPGIGKQIATVLATEMPELGSIDRRAAASLAGLAPHVQQSGARIGRAQIGGGRPCVRTALYMGALSAVRSNTEFKRAYLAMRAEGKPAKVALVATARKLVTIANSLAKQNVTFHPDHTPNT